MFPFDLDETDEIVELDMDEIKEEQADYEIDFTTGTLTGRIIKGLPAIIQWIRLALETERYVFNQFTWNYGSELNSLIGQSNTKEYVTSEVTRMVSDCLLPNEDITGISNLTVDIEGASLKVDFTVSTIYGSEEVQAYV